MPKDLGMADAYAFAVSKGYAGTREEFAELMASYAHVAEEAQEAREGAEAAQRGAETAESNAQGFAQTASEKASEAAQSASQASGSASTASEKAQVATTKASEASQSAQNASTSATTASNKASEASASAQSASNAKDDAITAKTDAETARTGAETARTQAQTAKTGAETARDAVQASADQIDDNTDAIAEIQSNGIVPTARQLLSDKYAVDEEPYKYRASYSGDRMDDEIVGGSIVWNQFANLNSRTMFGITVSRVSESVLRVAGTISSVDFGYVDSISSATQFQTTHVYIVWVNGPSSASSYLKFHQGSKATPDILNSPRIFKYAGGTSGNCLETIATGDVDYTFHWNKIDLTQMFGTEVADYIYNLEQANAGAGVAYFRKLFPNDYYEYDAGTLKHVEGVSSHEMVGFNLFDDVLLNDLENLTKTSNGFQGTAANWSKATAQGTRWDGINYHQNIVYCMSAYIINSGTTTAARFEIYHTDGTVVLSNKVEAGQARRVSVVSDPSKTVDYIKFNYGSNGGQPIIINDICINISDPSRNGTYEPYVKHSYPLDSSLTLRGTPKLGDNGLYFDGDRYKADGTVERRYGIVDLGTLPWLYHSETAHFYVTISTSKTTGANFLCSKYSYNGTAETSAMANKTTGLYRFSNIFRVKDTDYTDAATFKAAMSGVYLVYELVTPTTETATQYTALQTVDARGTEEYVSTSIVPVGHYTKYYDDLRKKLDGLPWNLDMIAPIETGTTASQAYAVGKYFLLNYQLCKAKTAIASGATFTLNTNYEVTTVADELYTALHA